MNKLEKSNLWMPEIMKISNLFNQKGKNIVRNNTNNNHTFWDIYNKSNSNSSSECKKGACLPLIKSTFVEGSGKYIYWNHYPNMIIDLDWLELNRKTPCNIILTNKK